MSTRTPQTAALSPATQALPPAAQAQQFISEAELATRWDLSPRTLRRWRSEGHGPRFATLGNSIRYPLLGDGGILDWEARYPNRRTCAVGGGTYAVGGETGAANGGASA